MNTAHINIDPETGEEIATDDRKSTLDTDSNNRNNLRPRPTKTNAKHYVAR